jgi:hypothetical protein
MQNATLSDAVHTDARRAGRMGKIEEEEDFSEVDYFLLSLEHLVHGESGPFSFLSLLPICCFR